jgi:alanine racemase
MKPIFRHIPLQAFGTKPLLVIRDIAAVVHNYRLFQQRAEATGSICAAVVKADVHGLKARDVAPALFGAGARHFFVEELVEGIELRKILPQTDAKIYALGRPNPKIADYTLERFQQAFGGEG